VAKFAQAAPRKLKPPRSPVAIAHINSFLLEIEKLFFIALTIEQTEPLPFGDELRTLGDHLDRLDLSAFHIMWTAGSVILGYQLVASSLYLFTRLDT
jgi:hypothetical protein